ncbi:acyl-CoA synthetase (AMP-forming)/AMP-acid ligase II [Nocardia tenerifensis]|uniref:Acyl-CoA synthetase (AMP-forming)/AMP-acid ligase II n=1 Tax=Nocardia tenerifensis TaxID=228006 RepID=A0A318KP62_9NOCA|nr:AMP-binding protein [Nocardia tenerifensis]PXX71470.1 acyl-CoA synthetase (AMP-forming)/AMP-acid ligase II [Nocardia tenerifensis]
MIRPQNNRVSDIVDEAARDAAQARAVTDADGSWTYRVLAERSADFAEWLAGQGVSRGDRVVVQLRSRRELVAMFYGCARLGAIFVPLNPAMKEFHLSSVLINAEPVLVIAEGAGVEPLRGLAAVPVHDLAELWPEVIGVARGATAAPAGPEPGDIAVLVYTSGSTSAPKAVICPHAQMTFAARAIDTVLRYRADDVVFCRFPLSWDYGLYKVLLSGLGRSELVLAGEESDLQLLRRMREVGATVVPIVPSLAAMIVTLAQRESAAPPPVRMFTNTGAALPVATISALRQAFPGARVVRQFGQTECKRISIMPPDQDDTRPSSVGLPLPGTEVRILDHDDNPVPSGEVGEIVVVGPHVMPGYWRAPDLSAATFERDEPTGYLRLRTGDYGSLDDEGYLYFEGRRDDMFKRKGIRMSTLEIESAALDIPGVRTAAVLPPDDGRDLTIFVESDLEPHVVLKELARRLEQAKVPAVCRIVAELPLTLHGKHARQALAAMLSGEPR